MYSTAEVKTMSRLLTINAPNPTQPTIQLNHGREQKTEPSMRKKPKPIELHAIAITSSIDSHSIVNRDHITIAIFFDEQKTRKSEESNQRRHD
ncbi:hypothetical protein PRIPAC_97261 [Pristionchus pacificus]|uniref:Uncharacterized protein n=1 Tax=Pristionchus pacificus TaxID=54126 RepID=A0A2A6D2I4_PRIPA|nr:hypothetical protein PRIPAC_97261 [Pristionchus pacificus]|eukprot:PDM84600.1 hypothetical protein PRIPAC_33623 [Pristionchus pacificus]